MTSKGELTYRVTETPTDSLVRMPDPDSVLHASERRSEAIHFCSLCGKPRSASYHARHPVRPGEKPVPGICSRPQCARAKAHALSSASSVPPVIKVICEVHHRYVLESSPRGSHAPLSLPELPGDGVKRERIRSAPNPPYPLSEPFPPVVNRASKPTFTLSRVR